MELEKTRIKIRCEFGACKGIADYTVVLRRVGIRSRLHVCSDCLKTLGELIGKTFGEKRDDEKQAKPPRSIETLKGKKNKVVEA